MSSKHKKVCTNSTFLSLIGFSIGVTSSAIGLKIFAITAEIKSQ